MDFRLQNEIRRWIREQGIVGDYDEVSLAGSAKDIVSGTEAERAHLLKQIKISTNLHCSCQVVLIHHSDCGAYNGAYNFKSVEEEFSQQAEDMQKAEDIIKNKFPEIKVIKVWAKMKDEEGKEVEFIRL
jgi:hypothetical protein